MKICTWGVQNAMTNMTDSHTRATGGVNLLTAVVFVTHREFVQLTRDVISRPRIHVPIGVYSIVGRGR